MTMTNESPLMPLAHAATRRLGRLHVWASVRERVTWIAGVAAASAVLRPFVWPLRHEAALHSALRALAFAAIGAVAVTAVIVVRAWRTRPTLLAATRRLDGALGTPEVIASGVAFERAQRDDEMATFAITRARAAAHGARPKALFPIEAVERPKWFRLMIVLAAAGILVGAVDRLVVERAIHPVTASEKETAAALKDAARVEPKAQELSPNQQAMAEAAKRAAEAAERGDRQGAMEALEDVRKAERAEQAEDRERAKSLRALKDELEGKKSGSHVGADADALGKDDVDRLQKAEEAARAAGLAEAAAALKEAKEAAQRGDAAGAKKALERGREALAKAEKRSATAKSTTTKLGEKASALDRSLRAGQQGKEPAREPGEKGAGEKGSKGESGKSSPREKGQSPGPGGGGPGDRDPIADPKRVRTNGDLQARTDVREGEKAVRALDGVGKGGEAKEYKEIFPAYDTVVEDGLREDNVPAARRSAVRRYFQSIRPGEEESK